MPEFLLVHPERHAEAFKRLKFQTETSVSELMRRMHEHCLQPRVLDEMFPTMSGTLDVAER